MSDEQKYIIIVKDAPTEPAREGLYNFLERRLKNKPPEQIRAYISKFPLVITRQADRKGAEAIANELTAQGINLEITPPLSLGIKPEAPKPEPEPDPVLATPGAPAPAPEPEPSAEPASETTDYHEEPTQLTETAPMAQEEDIPPPLMEHPVTAEEPVEKPKQTPKPKQSGYTLPRATVVPPPPGAQITNQVYAPPFPAPTAPIYSQGVPQALPVMSRPVPEGSVCSQHHNALASAVCDRCGDFICQTCTFNIQYHKYCPQCAPVVYGYMQMMARRLPWDRRRELGFFKAMFQTITLLLLKPKEFFNQMPLAGDLLTPLWFAVAATLITSIPSGILVALSMSFMPGTANMPGFASSMGIMMVPMMIIGGLIGIFIYLGIASVIYYLSAYLLGARASFDLIFRIVSYVIGTLQVIGLVIQALNQIGNIAVMSSVGPGLVAPMIIGGISVIMGIAMTALIVYLMYHSGVIVLKLTSGRAVIFGFSLIVFFIAFAVILAAIIFLILAILGEFP